MSSSSSSASGVQLSPQQTERLESLFLRCTAVVKRNFNKLEKEYGQPAMNLLLTSFEKRPVVTLTVVVFGLYALTPVALFLATSLIILLSTTLLALSAAAVVSIGSFLVLGSALLGVLFGLFFLAILSSISLVFIYIFVRLITHLRMRRLSGIRPWASEIKSTFITKPAVAVPPTSKDVVAKEPKEEENSDLDVVSNPDKSDEDSPYGRKVEG